jgi:regulator of nucleoside diphosphate kinase
MFDFEETGSECRPPIVLTAVDRQYLLALLDDSSLTIDMQIADFLKDEIARADIVPDDVTAGSVVRLGSEIKFIDHADDRIRCAYLLPPEKAQHSRCISILSSVGCALVGLGPGQSIGWTEHGTERRLTVLEVRTNES